MDFPINSMVIFHSYVNVYQRVNDYRYYSHQPTGVDRSQCGSLTSVITESVLPRRVLHSLLTCAQCFSVLSDIAVT